MSDAVSDSGAAPALRGGAPGAPTVPGSPDPSTSAGADAARLEASTIPPLAWLTALAALTTMGLNQVLLPALGPSSKSTLLTPLGRAAMFSVNLTAVAGLIALGFGLLSLVRSNHLLKLRQRLMIAAFAGVLLPSIALSALFERQMTTAEGVLFAIGAAQVLIGMFGTASARAATDFYRRGIGLLFALMAVTVLSSQLLLALSRTMLDGWIVESQQVLQSVGEVCYLLLLLLLSPLLLQNGRSLRARLSRLVGYFLLPVTLGALYIAERTLENDYSLLLYHALRVTLFIDSMPRLYSIPIGLVLASGVGGAISSDPLRRQMAAGTLLLLASGYAPLAPGRLLTSVLGALLIARPIMFARQAAPRWQPRSG